MFGASNKPLNAKQPSPQTEWMVGPNGIEAIVFVHGILGDKKKTWGKFPELLESDEELPLLDVLCWGYESGLVPGSYQDVETEAACLISGLRTLLNTDEDIYLVCHSMGGLVALKGVVQNVLNGDGRVHPVSSIQLITLYATPMHGSGVADVVSYGAKLHWAVRLLTKVLPHKQLDSLRRGKFVQDLLRMCNEHVYRPDSQNTLIMERIPVQACTANQDAFVSRSSAIGIFQSDPPPIHLSGTHFSVKEPDHHLDLRYLALKKNLNDCLRVSFHSLCEFILNDCNEKHDREEALERFDKQYIHLIRKCLTECIPNRLTTEDDERRVALSMMHFGIKGRITPEEAVRCVIRQYRYRGDSRLSR